MSAISFVRGRASIWTSFCVSAVISTWRRRKTCRRYARVYVEDSSVSYTRSERGTRVCVHKPGATWRIRRVIVSGDRRGEKTETHTHKHRPSVVKGKGWRRGLRRGRGRVGVRPRRRNGGGSAGSILGNQIVVHGGAVSESLTINPPRRRAAKQ